MHTRSSSRSNLFRLSFLAILVFAIFANPQSSLAHPMGNFSISHYTGIRVEPAYIELRYIIDMAEIPTYQEMQETGLVPKEGSPGVDAYLVKKAEFLARGLALEVNGRRLPLQIVSKSVIFPPGAGGLPTMKLGFVYRAPLADLNPVSSYAVHYRDDNFPGRAGWKEIVVPTQPGLTLTASSAPPTDRSSELSNYPTDLLNSPPQAIEASFSFSPILATAISPSPAAAHLSSASSPTSAAAGISGSHAPSPDHTAAKAPRAAHPELPRLAEAPPVTALIAAAVSPLPSATPLALRANQVATPRSKFTEMISVPNPGSWFLFTAALLAAGLGALHALEPGHGKTIVAAYLVGSKGTAKHAICLGVIVTLAHTAGVYLLGALTLYASRYILPEQLYPWLEILSGLVIAAVASFLLVRAWSGESGEHRHDAGASHSHWFSSLGGLRQTPLEAQPLGPNLPLSLAHAEAAPVAPAKTVSLTQLLSLGISGGIVPCPAALVVLLSALSLHRIGLGLFLIVAFSLGLAAVLIATGLVMVYARQLLARWKTDGPFVKRWLPLASGTFMLLLGLSIAGRALLKTATVTTLFAHGTLPSFTGVVLLGLFLGMRHSTDPDHVIAVSTIASRERSVSRGALIGVLWGIGHTLTIFLVGSAIILFGLVIPPRVGLSMEFSVALMLIFLGVLNLTGALSWLNSRFSPSSRSSPPQIEVSAAPSTPGNLVDRLLSRYGSYQVFRPLFIGLVHGLAGSAAVALLVLSTIHTPLWAIAYLLVFGIGTVIGMMLMTSAMAVPVVYTGKHFAAANRYLTPLSGIVSTAFGLVLLYRIGFVDGLFRANVHWTPQ
jgi:ABC-type nickel/cobalt efflux system permease component RcnA